MTDDGKVSQRYRELGAEEPPQALDVAILAAARREAGARPGPLAAPVVRSGRQRWYAPLATAAVLVLAVAVTLQMQHDRPGVESPVPQAESPRDQAAAETSPASGDAALKLRVEAQLKSAAAKAAQGPAATRRAAIPAETGVSAAPAAREPQPFAANQGADSAGSVSARSAAPRRPDSIVVGSSARQVEDRVARDAEAAAQAPRMASVEALAKRAERAAAQEIDTPERELERIVVLRAQGRHDEADKALAELRKRHPEFKIPEATLGRVERR